MKAYQCDRCGKMYSNRDWDNFCNQAANFNNYVYIVTKSTLPDSFSHDLDLCPDCTMDLHYFIDHKKETK